MESDNSSIISFGQLPVELIEIVINFIPYNSIPKSSQVCRYWYHFLKTKNQYIYRSYKQTNTINNSCYLTTGSIRLYLDNQYLVTLKKNSVSEYHEQLHAIQENNTILE